MRKTRAKQLKKIYEQTISKLPAKEQLFINHNRLYRKVKKNYSLNQLHGV
jgi:mannitol-specific phosphotransferase system IIBC component